MIFQKQTCRKGKERKGKERKGKERKGKDKQMKCPYRNLGQKHQMKIRSKAQNFGRVWPVRLYYICLILLTDLSLNG